jgi:2,3-bisphosphoglycerate-independent phosphoglycerate mutase
LLGSVEKKIILYSHEKQILAMVELAAKRGLSKIYMHAFLDGRDVPPKSAEASIKLLEAKFAALGVGRIVSIVGRFYAMDRDNRWARVKSAYDLIAKGEAGFCADSALQGLAAAYDRGETDEFVLPTAVLDAEGHTVALDPEDSVVFMNFRADRAHEISQALTSTTFASFFLNGGTDTPFPGEDRILLPSPKVRTYDLQPEMKAPEVTDHLVDAITGGKYDVIICNYANCDMVRHTGIIPAAILAMEAVDRSLQRVVDALKAVGGKMLLTADHGNIEQMVDKETGQPHTAHTTNPVPLVYVCGDKPLASGGGLSDLAPTMLAIFGVEQPAEMTGRSLINSV